MTYSDFKEEWWDEKPYIIAHTSGSTGKPKEIRLMKSDMIESAKATNRFFGVNEKSMLAIPLSFDYIAAKMMAVRSFVANCSLQVVEPKNEFDMQLPISLLSIVPSQAEHLINHPEWNGKIGSIIIGGAPVNVKTEEKLLSKGFNVYCSYGMTETCSHVALRKIGEDSTFEGLPGIAFSQDERSCLVIDAPHFSFKRMVTNDIVELIDNRHFLWKGRHDNVVISGGIKIFPENVEREIGKHYAGIFYIRGIADDKWGESLEMVIEGSSSKEGNIIMEMLRERMPHHLCPSKISVVERIPRTSTGKLKREKGVQEGLKKL